MLALSSQRIFDRVGRLSFPQALKNAMRKLQAAQHMASKGLKLERLTKEELDEAAVFYGVPHFMSNTAFKLGPVALTTTLTTNIFNAGTTTGGVACTSSPFDKLYVIFNHFQIVNKTASAATASLWIGATGANAAGTEFWVSGYSVPANNSVNWYGRKRFGQADFLVGGAGTATALSLDGEGEIGIGA